MQRVNAPTMTRFRNALFAVFGTTPLQEICDRFGFKRVFELVHAVERAEQRRRAEWS